MFTYVKLKNYRSLGNVNFDLRETKEKVKKIAAVYGENGCGKSTLMKSFYFLQQLMHSFDLEKTETKILKYVEKEGSNGLPLDLFDIINNHYFSKLLKNARTIDSLENTELEFGFKINGHEGNYKISFNDVIEYERLYYYTGKQSGIIFELSKDNNDPKFSSQIFKSSKIISEVKERTLKYWGRHSLLAIIADMSKELNEGYVEENISEYLFDFQNMINETSIIIKEGHGEMGIESSKKINFLSELEKGSVSSEKRWLIENSEKILNDFFTQTYSDIKKVHFETKAVDDRIVYHLVFSKNINGKIREIPVEEESTGTRKIIDISRSLFGAFCGCTVIIDEIDNGVHDLLLKSIIDSMIANITGQLIFTTHNTSLLESLDAKMAYIINGDYNGEKEIVCLSEYNIQDHNSRRLRYMKGLYGGIPFIDGVDYNEIIEKLNTKKIKGEDEK